MDVHKISFWDVQRWVKAIKHLYPIKNILVIKLLSCWINL